MIEAATRLADPGGRLPLLTPALGDLLRLAARELAPGWGLELVGGDGPLAVELRLVGPGGQGFPRQTGAERGPVYEAYRGLADLVWSMMRAHFPALEERLAWGGCWTTETGAWRVGYFDLGGRRGRGRYRPPGRRKNGGIYGV